MVERRIEERDGRPTQSVERTCAVLAFLTEQPRAASVTAIAAHLGVHKSTVVRLLAPLESAGLVERDPLTGLYQLGLGIVAMTGGVLSRITVLRVADPQLRLLAEVTRQTVNLGIRYRDTILNVEQIPGPNLDQSVGWLGRRVPLHLGAGAKALLAHLADAEIDVYLRSVAGGPNAVEPIRFRETVRGIRRQGYAVNRGELHPEVWAVGAPIFDADGRACAAVSVAGLRPEFTEPAMADFGCLVVKTARTVSRQLGFVAGPVAQLA